MKITLKELRSIVRESVRSHLKETERRDLLNQENPFIGSDVSRETSTNDPEFLDMVRPIFDKYSWSINGRPPAIHHFATIDSYPDRFAEPASLARRAARNLRPRDIREKEREFSRDIGNVKRLAIREVAEDLAEELGLDTEEVLVQVLELPAAKTALGLSGGLTLANLAGIAQKAYEELSSNDNDMAIEDLIGN